WPYQSSLPWASSLQFSLSGNGVGHEKCRAYRRRESDCLCCVRGPVVRVTSRLLRERFHQEGVETKAFELLRKGEALTPASADFQRQRFPKAAVLRRVRQGPCLLSPAISPSQTLHKKMRLFQTLEANIL